MRVYRYIRVQPLAFGLNSTSFTLFLSVLVIGALLLMTSFSAIGLLVFIGVLGGLLFVLRKSQSFDFDALAKVLPSVIINKYVSQWLKK